MMHTYALGTNYLIKTPLSDNSNKRSRKKTCMIKWGSTGTNPSILL